ncbi:2558_t:CDS:2 [Entrophospora sp. SA101]|nr:2558_t:CDS:2 [Entrophospora sp. SA101]
MQAQTANLTISSSILLNKAQQFANLLNITDFGVLVDESTSAPLDQLPEERERLQNLISNYSLCDVFNCGETDLYWNTEPSKTLATNKISGTKNSKNRVTIL